jgi:CubicO group peptidase (beta-lactamase class C family)
MVEAEETPHFQLERETMMTKTFAALALAGICSAAIAAADPEHLPPGGASILTWTPEQQAWGYKNMEKLAPFRVIKRGEAVHALPKGSAIDVKFTAGDKSYDTDSYMQEFRASGVLVIKNGKVVLERYALGRTAKDRWTSFSVAKSVTSTLIGAAIQDGKIKSLDDKVTQYIPEMKGSAYDDVTVRQLITMTSGVKWNESYTDPNSDVAKVGLSILEPGVNPVVSYMRRLPREAAPGSKFVYKTGETDLAGIVLSNAVGKPLAEYLSDKVWRPYGMEQDGIWVEDVAGHERGGCCISMTLRDYGRVGQFMLEHGVIDGQEVVPAGWTEDATSKHVAEPPYGYFWWIIPGGYEAEGIFGQTMSVFPKEHLVIVINSAWPAAWSKEIDAVRHKYLAAIRAAAH